MHSSPFVLFETTSAITKTSLSSIYPGLSLCPGPGLFPCPPPLGGQWKKSASFWLLMSSPPFKWLPYNQPRSALWLAVQSGLSDFCGTDGRERWRNIWLPLKPISLGRTDDLTDHLDFFQNKTPQIKFKLPINESLRPCFSASRYKYHLLDILFRSWCSFWDLFRFWGQFPVMKTYLNSFNMCDKYPVSSFLVANIHYLVYKHLALDMGTAIQKDT